MRSRDALCGVADAANCKLPIGSIVKHVALPGMCLAPETCCATFGNECFGIGSHQPNILSLARCGFWSKFANFVKSGCISRELKTTGLVS
ncbi:MAG TPA: hypothetical protein VH254_00595, partial [Candidatus Udaeobacter sp.]|nr:hypothetical protein [Candidatus Udaeobacter sp.]